MMKLHPRFHIVRKSEIELKEKVYEWMEGNGLTDIESLQVLNDVFNSSIGGYLKYMLRYERHGEYDSQGDIANDD